MRNPGYSYTTQRQLIGAFWDQHPELKRLRVKIITNYSGNERMYVTDIRCAFIDWIDCLQKHNEISEALADRAILEPPARRKAKN